MQDFSGGSLHVGLLQLDWSLPWHHPACNFHQILLSCVEIPSKRFGKIHLSFDIILLILFIIRIAEGLLSTSTLE